MEPATTIIGLCGGHAAVAEMCGVDVSRVHRWTYSKERGGTGGVVPVSHQQTLLSAARARGINLLPEHFFTALPPVAATPQEKSTKLAKNAIAEPAIDGDAISEAAE